MQSEDTRINTARNKIAAVVVTYNRYNLLVKCIEGLRKQTKHINEIYVVDNSSTDGTSKWLGTQKDLTIITQQNSGSAGGFYSGIKVAFDKGHEWIWCMDDDCLPACDALEKLSAYMTSTNLVLNCLVVSNKDDRRLSFGLYEVETRTFYEDVESVAKKELLDNANFFNGVLLNRKVIKVAGLPLIDLFIRGEEIEYYHRIKSKGFQVRTITSAVIKHPPANIRVVRTPFYNHRFENLDAFKRYYRARNFVYVMRKHHNFSYKSFFKILFLDLYGTLFFQKSLKLFFVDIQGLVRGLYFRPKS